MVNVDEARRELARRELERRKAETAPDRGALSAAAGSMIEGLPIVGPLIKSGVDQGVAGLRSLRSGKSVADELEAVEQGSASTADAHPVANVAGSVAGGVMGTVPMVMAAPAAFGAGAGGLVGRSVASGLSGGALGGADAYVRSGGDVEAAKDGALWGLGLGAVAPGIGAVAGKATKAVVEKVRPNASVPTVPELKGAATAAYDAAKQSGVRVSQPAFKEFADDLFVTMKNEGIDPSIHPEATAALNRLLKVANDPTLEEIETLRRVIKGAADNPTRGSQVRLAGKMEDALDSFIDRLRPDDVIAGDPAVGAAALKEARAAWSRAKKAEMISEAVLKAERRAARSGTGGNTENAIRQNVDAILSNPKKSRGFTEREKALMDSLVRGTKGQNALRQVGRLSPTTGGLSAMLTLGAAMVEPTTAAVGMTGLGAKALADRGVRRSADYLDEFVRAGGNIPQSQSGNAAKRRTEALVRALLAPSPLYANQQLVAQ
jgi:hypothetical protein